MRAAIECRSKSNGPIPCFTEKLGDYFEAEGLVLRFLCPLSKCPWFEEGQNSECKWDEDACENPAAILNMVIRAEDMLMKLREQMNCEYYRRVFAKRDITAPRGYVWVNDEP